MRPTNKPIVIFKPLRVGLRAIKSQDRFVIRTRLDRERMQPARERFPMPGMQPLINRVGLQSATRIRQEKDTTSLRKMRGVISDRFSHRR